MKKIFFTLYIFFFTCVLSAQESVEMADTLREDGKIYVVVAVLVSIFLGVVVYLAMIDRKINHMEKKLKEK